MQVDKINTKNINFNARIKFFGQERALPKNALKVLQEKAASFGTEKDILYIFLESGKVIEKKLVRTFIGDFYKNSTINYFNKLKMAYNLASLKSMYMESSYTKIFGKEEVNCKDKTFEYINTCIDNVKEKFK